MNPAIVGEPAGQHLLALHVHLLARMKGVVQNIFLPLAVDPPLQPGVPLVGSTLGAGLRELVASLSGAESTYRTELVLGCSEQAADVRVGIGVPTGDVTVGADAWRAFLGEFVALSRWSDCCPLGPYFAATLAAAEVFKRLLRINLGWQEGALLEDAAYSLMDYSLNDHAASGPDLPEVTVRDLAVAGAGAGGTAALYTLASFPRVSGSVVAVEPGRLKESNLGRYLMSNYAQVHGHVHKLESVERFLEVHAPKLRCKVVDAKWHEVSRAWQTVLATVDTPEARWDVQRSRPAAVLDAGVMGLLFAVLRVVPGGWCLECKHPPDPEVTWRQRALRWGLTVGDVKQRYYNRVRVSMEDVERLADVQGRPVDDLKSLVGVPFDEVPALTECGQAALSLAVPSQAPVVPMSTTAAGIVLAAEIVKDSTGIGTPLHNYLVQDLRFRLRADGHKFKPRLPQCRSCSP
jgi:molybdopterin/thiamine biosynthesis adenylyltransferase